MFDEMINDLSGLDRYDWAIAQLLIVTAVVMWVAGVRAQMRCWPKQVHSTMNKGESCGSE